MDLSVQRLAYLQTRVLPDQDQIFSQSFYLLIYEFFHQRNRQFASLGNVQLYENLQLQHHDYPKSSKIQFKDTVLSA